MITDGPVLCVLRDVEVHFISGLLREAVERAAAVIPAEAVAGRAGGATLGFVATLWTGCAEGDGCEVVNVDGVRMFGVRLLLEEWEIVLSQLGQYALHLIIESDETTPVGREDLKTADLAVRLRDRILGALGGR